MAYCALVLLYWNDLKNAINERVEDSRDGVENCTSVSNTASGSNVMFDVSSMSSGDETKTESVTMEIMTTELITMEDDETIIFTNLKTNSLMVTIEKSELITPNHLPAKPSTQLVLNNI